MITPDFDMIIASSTGMTSQALISKIHCTLSANQKRDSEFSVQQHLILLLINKTPPREQDLVATTHDPVTNHEEDDKKLF